MAAHRRQAAILLVSGILAGTSAVATADVIEEPCFADCSGGLTPFNDRAPVPGTAAPDFLAVMLDGRKGTAEVRSLASLLDSRPLILAFGSYT